MANRKRRELGSTILEFTLVGIPLIFVLISIFEIARGMWLYDTLAHAVREGTRFAIVHGATCVPNPADPTSNSCQVTVGDIARRIQNAAVGLPADELTLTFAANNVALAPCLLQNCLTNTTLWPAAPNNTPGLSITINGVFPFRSAISMLWPGAGGMVFPAFNLPASSREAIQF
jgi:Flp pilus assembly protein TadG